MQSDPMVVLRERLYAPSVRINTDSQLALAPREMK